MINSNNHIRLFHSPMGEGKAGKWLATNDRTNAEQAIHINQLQTLNEELRLARRAALNLMEDTIHSREALRLSEEKYRTKLELEVQQRTAEVKVTQEMLQATLDTSLFVIQAFKAVRDDLGNIVDFIWVMNNRQGIAQDGNVTGESLLQRNPGAIDAGLFHKFVQVTETGVAINQEQFYNHDHFNGWYHQTLVKMGDGFVISTENISEKRNARDELLRLKDEIVQQATDKYLTLFNTIEEGFILFELIRSEHGEIVDYKYLEANPAFRKQVGLKPGELIEKAVMELFPTVNDGWIQMFQKVITNGKAMRFEHHVKETNSWYEVLFCPMSNDQMAVLYNNTTERKKAAEILFEKEREQLTN